MNQAPIGDALGVGEVPAGKHVIAVMGREGDSKHIWDKTKLEEVEAARALFVTLTGKGYRAFRVVDKEGNRGDLMNTFEPDAERVILVPPLRGG